MLLKSSWGVPSLLVFNGQSWSPSAGANFELVGFFWAWRSAPVRMSAKELGDAVKLPRRKYLHLSAGVGALVVCCLFLLNIDASSQPGRTFKVVVPFPAGASTDIFARLLGENISKVHGVTVVIAANSLVINPILRKVNYEPNSSFEPICHILNSPLVLAVNNASPYRTL